MLKTTPHSSPGLEPLREKSQNKSPITQELLNNFLYGREKVERIELHKSRKRKRSFEEQDKRKIQAARCEECCNSSQNECAVHSSSLPKLTYAVRSFPPEVQLCTSSIPGYKYGARAESPIPRGTWIGPYEGTHVYRTNVTEDKDNAYLWEIYENGQFSHFLDGSDENISSWMRFIRCARNKNEQNMTAFQYGTSIYYRALRDISVGEELLVWYDYTYTQFWGVPLALKSEMEVRGKGTIPEVPVVAQHSNLPGFQRPQPTQPKLSLSSQGTLSSPQTQSSPDQAVVYPSPSVSLTIPPTVPEPFSPTMASHTLKRSPQVPSQHLVARSYHVTQTQHYPQKPSISASHQLPPRPPQVSPQSQVPPSPYVPPQPRVPLLPHASTQPHAPTQPRIPLPPQVLPPSQPPPLPLVQAQSHVPTSPHVQPQSHVLRPPHLTQFPTTSVPQGTAMSQVTPYSIIPSSCRVTSGSHGASLSTVPTSPLSHQQYPSRVPPSPKLVSIHSSLGVSTKTTNHRTVTAQNSHEGMKDSASLTYTWSQADIKENMPVSTPINKTEIQFRSPYTSQSLNSSPLKSLSPSINKTATTECDEQDQNHVSSTVNCKEEYQESWKCGQCGEVFSQRVLLRMHECSRAPEKPYQCGHCSLTFANPSELRAHVVTHSNERPFKCGYCGRSFAGATTLSNHMRTHTGDRPHVCEKCKKTFVTAMQLSRHAKQPGECVLREKDALWVNKSLPITVE